MHIIHLAYYLQKLQNIKYLYFSFDCTVPIYLGSNPYFSTVYNTGQISYHHQYYVSLLVDNIMYKMLKNLGVFQCTFITNLPLKLEYTSSS